MTDLFVGGSCGECACDIAVTVVVPAFNCCAVIGQQLDALANQDTDRTWELVVADNGSTDDLLPEIRSRSKRFSHIRVIDASSRRGPAHARNEGARRAQGALLLFCDADDVADRYWLQYMARAVAPDTILAGRLDYTLLNDQRAQSFREPQQHVAAPQFYGLPYVISANMGIPQHLFWRLNGFDEHFTTAAGEDIDLPLRAADLGAAVVFVDGALMNYRLRSNLKEALAQAGAYGKAHVQVFERHPEALPFPTLSEDLFSFVVIVREAARHRLMGRSTAFAAIAMRMQWARMRQLWLKPGYWTLQRRRFVAPPYIGPKRVALKNAARRLVQRWTRDLAPAYTSEVDVGAELVILQRKLSKPDRYLLGSALLADADVTIEAARGLHTFYLNPSADYIVRDVIEHGGYSVEEVAAVLDCLEGGLASRGQLIINAGANIGTTAVAIASRGWNVLAIEPVPRAYALLERNVAANKTQGRIETVRAAITTHAGEIEMVAGDQLSTSEARADLEVNDLATWGDTRARVISVAGRCLYEILAASNHSASDIAAVWSDTEGSEASVIATGGELWARGVPLWVEIRPQALAHHTTISDFCALACAHFTNFGKLEDLASAAFAPISELRDFIDDLGFDRWAFTNVMLVNRGS